MIKNSLNEYGSVAKFFHWLIFLLILIMIPLGYFMDDVSDKLLRGEVVNLHKLIGILILALMVLRAIWAWMNVKPLMPPGSSRLEHWAERLGHLALYLFLIAMPISGWLMAVAAGKPPHYLGWSISLPIEKSKLLAGWCSSIHNTLAIVIIVFVSLHILAALYHHFIRKDNVLKRMWVG